MIPIKDNIKSRRFPIMNLTLIVANVLIFFHQLQLSPEEAYPFILEYGAIPANLVGGFLFFLEGDPQYSVVLPGAILSLFTATFLHGGWLHLLGNMVYLLVFGKNVENLLGPLGYLAVYLFMGAWASLFHIFFNPLSTVPLIGASGAIAGVLGIYFLLYPSARVLTLLPLGFFITLIPIPAVLFLGIWFLLQLFNALAVQSLGAGAEAVAWWAHVGGFLVGIIIGIFARRGRRVP